MSKEKEIGQALRLQGISEKEFKECVEKLKNQLGRKQVTWLELAEATGLSYQQIYRCKGEIRKDYDIMIVKEAIICKAVKRRKETIEGRKQIKKLVKGFYKNAEKNGVPKYIVNQFDKEVTPLVKRRNEIFENEGVNLGDWIELDEVSSAKEYKEAAEIEEKLQVYIIPKYSFEICQLETKTFFKQALKTIEEIQQIMKKANITIKEAVLSVE